jgi:hypothetical protein
LTTAEGGMVLTRREQHAARIKILAQQLGELPYRLSLVQDET